MARAGCHGSSSSARKPSVRSAAKVYWAPATGRPCARTREASAAASRGIAVGGGGEGQRLVRARVQRADDHPAPGEGREDLPVGGGLFGTARCLGAVQEEEFGAEQAHALGVGGSRTGQLVRRTEVDQQ